MHVNVQTANCKIRTTGMELPCSQYTCLKMQLQHKHQKQRCNSSVVTDVRLPCLEKVILLLCRSHLVPYNSVFFFFFFFNAHKIFSFRRLKRSWIIHDSCQFSTFRRHSYTILMEELQEAEENSPVLPGKLTCWSNKCFQNLNI